MPRRPGVDSTALAHAIGALEAQVKLLSDLVAEERQSASQHRSDLRTVIAALSASIQTLATEMRDVKPLVDIMREERSQAIGAAKWRRSVFSLLATVCGAIGAGLLELVRWALSK